jgi:uncharacterized cupredoxin-like copper-binding protein
MNDRGDAARALLIAALLVSSAACAREPDTRAEAHYTPVARNVTITTVPLLVKEQRRVLPFLEGDFAKGGVLEGKEVYGFSPSTVTVVEGDTINFALVNPEDDVHSFVLPDLAISLPPQKVTTATYVAKHAGIFRFICAVESHSPMMWGQLVVMSASTMTPPR